jgi:hypothetical protein
MAALRVVEHFDVIEHVRACLSARVVDLAANALALEQLEETLGHGAIVAVGAGDSCPAVTGAPSGNLASHGCCADCPDPNAPSPFPSVCVARRP